METNPEITIRYSANVEEVLNAVKELCAALERVAELQDRINSTKLEIKVESDDK